ncbi:MAG: adenylate/guanylate cyclase domain-containing protein [Campylobacterota bacterium]
MPNNEKREINRSISQRISKSKKEVTILFTDIEDSTLYWHKNGDVEGRLMVDRHNRILFPLVKKFRGRIVKTIGDSIMAMFKRPKDAMSAAIAMQQALRQERASDTGFSINVRIGMHTGEAIVEQDDVYGDIVNVAARVEEQAKGSEIALSSHTRKALKEQDFTFAKGESFIPKGKKRKMALFLCKWEDREALVDEDAVNALIPIASKQKAEILIYLVSLLGFSYFFYTRYLRFFLADNEYVSAFILNPGLMLREYIYIPAVISLVMIFVLYRLYKIEVIPHTVFKFVKGSFVASIVFLLSYFLLPMVPESYLPHAKDVYYKSDHLIVKVLEDDTAFYERPSSRSKVLFTLDSGRLMLLNDVKKVKKVVWNRVLLSDRNYAWVQRVIPPSMGVPRTRVTRTNSFVFYHIDSYMLLLSLIGFLWGYRSFTIKPF